MTIAQLNALAASVVSAFTAADVQALSAAQLNGLSKVNFQALNVSCLTAAQLAALSTTTVVNLTTAQMANFTASALNALASAPRATLSAAQLNALPITAVSGLSAAAAQSACGRSAQQPRKGGFPGAEPLESHDRATGGPERDDGGVSDDDANRAALDDPGRGADDSGTNAMPAADLSAFSNAQDQALTVSQISGMSAAAFNGLNVGNLLASQWRTRRPPRFPGSPRRISTSWRPR